MALDLDSIAQFVATRAEAAREQRNAADREARECDLMLSAIEAARENGGSIPAPWFRNNSTRRHVRMADWMPPTIREKLHTHFARHTCTTSRDLASWSGEKYASVRAALSHYPEFVYNQPSGTWDMQR